ncbi:MAG: CotH kinase family protein [Bacteroidales bacterium]
MKRIIIFATTVILLSISTRWIQAQTINHWESIVLASDTWKYFPGLSEPPADWADQNFDDNSWTSGPGGIGYGDGDDATIIGSVPSVYLRIKFSVTDLYSIVSAVLNVDFDDGFVAYLNGHEIARANMQSYPYRPKYNDYAILTTYEAQLPTGGKPALFIINRDTLSRYLINGQNTLALQVHNCNATSSDLSSTTFLSVGLNDAITRYRTVPAWFTDPFVGFTSRLPIVSINTQGQTIGNSQRVIASCKVIDNGYGQLNTLFQNGTDYEGNIGIKVRGQSSQMFPKKSYSVELWNDAGADSSAILLGMPSEEDWVLHAHYSDKSMLRNAISFYLGSKMGRWQPRFRYCSVYLNGEYNGIYLLMENVKRGADRLNISKLQPDEVSGNDVTGGYILKVDKTGGLSANEYFTPVPSVYYSNSRSYNFTYVYPDADIINTAQKDYIKSYLEDLETNLNKGTKITEYLDISSFVDFQIIQELSNNVDGYRYSTFFHKKKDSEGGKLYAGPLWDFDLCYGNVNYSDLNLSTSQWLYPHYGPDESYPMHWWARLMEDVSYRRNFTFRWKDLRKGPLATSAVIHFIDSVVTYLGPSVNDNFTRWPILGTWVWPNYFVGSTYQEEVNYFKNWILARLDWMDNNVPSLDELIDERYDGKILLFPNPVDDMTSLIFNLIYTKEVKIGIYDLSGRLVQEIIYHPAKYGMQQTDLDLAELDRGIYVLQILQGKSKVGTKKIIKR